MAKTEQVLCLEPQHELKFKGKGRPPPRKRLSPASCRRVGAAWRCWRVRSCALPQLLCLEGLGSSGSHFPGAAAAGSLGQNALRLESRPSGVLCLPQQVSYTPLFWPERWREGDPGTGRRLRLLGPGCCLGRMGVEGEKLPGSNLSGGRGPGPWRWWAGATWWQSAEGWDSPPPFLRGELPDLV